MCPSDRENRSLRGRTVPKTSMIAERLRAAAWRRIDRVEAGDEGRNARSAIALIDAAGYVLELPETDRVVVRMTMAGCFTTGRFDPGPAGERLIEHWHRTEPGGGPADLLAAVATVAERDLAPAADLPRPRAATR
jgi:hypothetical protein